MSCGVGCRRGSDPALLWLRRRPVATAPIRPLAWEPPYAAGAAQEIATTTTDKKKDKRQKNKSKKRLLSLLFLSRYELIIWLPFNYFLRPSEQRKIFFPPALPSHLLLCLWHMEVLILGQGLNPSHSSNLSQSSDNTGSLTH